MPSPSKAKGNGFERELVNQAKGVGLNARRAYASNGQSLGMHEEVDLLLEGLKGQAKRRKKLPEVVRPNENVDIQVVRENHGKAFVVIPYDHFLFLLCKLKLCGQTPEKAPVVH